MCRFSIVSNEVPDVCRSFLTIGRKVSVTSYGQTVRVSDELGVNRLYVHVRPGLGTAALYYDETNVPIVEIEKGEEDPFWAAIKLWARLGTSPRQRRILEELTEAYCRHMAVRKYLAAA